MPNLQLVGGDIETDGADVTIHAPRADLSASAIVTNPVGHALLVPKDRDADEAMRCVKCKRSTDIVVSAHMPDGFAMNFCRGCIGARQPGNPLVIDIELME